MTSKPNETDSQTNIDIEVVNRIYGKTKSMLDWPLLYPLPQQRMPLTHFPLKGVLGVEGVLGAPTFLARTRARRAARPGPHSPWGPPFKGNLLLYKVARPVQVKHVFFQGFYLDWPLYRGILCWGKGIKWPVQVKMCFFRGFTWTGHFIEAYSHSLFGEGV